MLTGVVLSSVDCSPIAGAQVHLCRFRFEGPKPVPYEGRLPHIHIRVVAPEHELLHSRYVLRTRTTTRGHVRLVLRPERL